MRPPYVASPFTTQASRLCMSAGTDRHPHPRRRAFTLLEIMLAAALGSIVVVTCWSVLSMITRSDREHQARHRANLEMSLTRRTFERSFQTIVVSDTTPPPEVPKEGTFAGRGASVDPNDARYQPTETQIDEMNYPRFIIEDDTTMPAAMRGGDGNLYYPQRLAIALSAPPVFPAPRDELTDAMLNEQIALLDAQNVAERVAAKQAAKDAKEAAEDAADATKDALSGEDAQATEDSEGESEADVIVTDPIAPGVRGVFELRPDTWSPPSAAQLLGTAPPTDEDLTPRPSINVDGEEEIGWTLWWRTIPDGPSLSLAYTEGEETLTEKERIERARSELLAASTDAIPLIRGLRSLTYEVYDDSEFKDKFSMVWAQQLPAYVNVRYETLGGRRGEWMFEIGWIIGKSPGSTTSTAEDTEDASGNNANGNPEAAPTDPNAPPSVRDPRERRRNREGNGEGGGDGRRRGNRGNWDGGGGGGGGRGGGRGNGGGQ